MEGPTASSIEPVPRCTWRLLLITLIFFLTQAVGSAFNIWYNLLHIEPLLTKDQLQRFQTAILGANLTLYPIGIGSALMVLWSVHPVLVKLSQRLPVDAAQLAWARARTINLPWWALCIAGCCWLSCIPWFLTALLRSPDPLDARVLLHLPASLLISGSIAVTIGFFCVELSILRWLYPLMFRDQAPHGIPGSYPLSLRGRGVMWVLSSSLSPVGCLLLLTLLPESLAGRGEWFAITVAGVAVAFGLIGVWAISNLLLEPVNALRQAARSVQQGQLDETVLVLRADEFGPLISTMNAMLHDLREKQRVEELFGRHVGRDAASRLLAHRPGMPAGIERELTVLFADLRGFTAYSEQVSASAAVAWLNRFLSEMVDVVEQSQQGMVNKFLGDGLMALFGVIDDQTQHAERAVVAACEMQQRLSVLNAEWARSGHPALQMGIGIATGSATVGSIGSTHRGEFTAIGSTVNLASRIESHTKSVGRSILLSSTTREALSPAFLDRSGLQLEKTPPATLRGVAEPQVLWAVG